MRVLIDLPHNADSYYRDLIVELAVYDTMLMRRTFDSDQAEQLEKLASKWLKYMEHMKEEILGGYQRTSESSVSTKGS